MNIDQIVKKLLEAKDAYYNSDSPIMTDSEFDELEESLRESDPENPYFKIVGAEKIKGKKINHKIPMLSMQKSKDVSAVAKWIDKLGLEKFQFCIQPKIDGLSASCYYKNGKLQYIATRGDGVSGQDITYIAEYLKDIPLTINVQFDELEIRGELYLPVDTDFNTEGRPLRNACVGLINRKENREELKHVRFIAYKVLRTDAIQYESDKIEFLLEKGFHSVVYKQAASIEDIDEFYKLYLKKNRTDWKYETDGLIVTVDDNSLFKEIDSRWVVSHHHHYIMALKPPSEAKETELVNIEWQISRQGMLIPVALFEKVTIGGAQLTRASLHNFENVKNLKLAIGDTLLIERANDVIPYVKDNLSISDDKEMDKGLVPEVCPSCESPLVESGVNMKCPNSKCPEVIIQQIIFWVKSSDVENIAEATIRKLFHLDKINSVKDLYLLSESDFEGIEGFAEKKIKNFVTEIGKSRKMKAQQFISKLGIPLVQKKSLSNLGIYKIKDFLSFNDETYVIGQNIIKWKSTDENLSYLNSLLEVLEVEDEEKPLERETVCMTGKGPAGRKELISQIEEMGYEFVSTITKKTNILVCEDPESSSSKLKKAEKIGVKIISYDDFFNN